MASKFVQRFNLAPRLSSVQHHSQAPRGERTGVLTAIYEVKTNLVRQTLYSAIGQVLVDGEDSDCGRFLVLPSGAPFAVDLSRALTRANISVLHFDIRNEKVSRRRREWRFFSI